MYLIVWYDDLRSRAARGQRFEPIQFSEIAAYRDLFDLEIDPFEVELLCKLDGIWQLAQPSPRQPYRPKGR